jgi:hypothetical protein
MFKDTDEFSDAISGGIKKSQISFLTHCFD